MASISSKFSYKRLKQEGGLFHDEDHCDDYQVRQRVVERSTRSRWSRVRARVHIRRRLKIRIPSLRRFLRRKVGQVRVGLGKVVKRLKESQAHFGDLFAGNYLFMQVTPTPSLDNKPYSDHVFYGGFSSKYNFSRDSRLGHV